MGYAPEAGKQNVGDQSFALLRTLPYERDYGAKPQTFRLTTKNTCEGDHEAYSSNEHQGYAAPTSRPIRLMATNDIHATHSCNSPAVGSKHFNRAPFIVQAINLGCRLTSGQSGARRIRARNATDRQHRSLSSALGGLRSGPPRSCDDSRGRKSGRSLSVVRAARLTARQGHGFFQDG